MNQKGFIKDLVIIVLAVLLLGGGYFYFSKKPAYAPAENQDQVSDWNVYIDDMGGYSFKYPKDWERKSQGEGCGPVFAPKDNENVWLTVCGPYINPEDGTPQELAGRTISDGEKILSKEDLSLDGHSGVTQESVSGNEYEYISFVGGVKSKVTIDGESANIRGTIGIYFYDQDDKDNTKDLKPLFKKIIYTFKFTK
ncbi:MAG: hypothetical protein Q8Q95_02585 [bacterium]|nr:hypothetical protein [bacterium]